MLQGFSEVYLLGMGAYATGLLVTLAAFLAVRPWKSRRRIFRLAGKAFFAAWTTLLLLFFLEAGFALFYDTTDSFALANTSRRWEARHVRHNNMGFRDAKDFTLKTPPGARRILLMGDSFTFGHGVSDVSDRFGDILERKCAQAFSWPTEIYNVSVPGLSTAGAVTMLDGRFIGPGQLVAQRGLFGAGLQFDALLLVYNLNDVEDLDENTEHIIGSIVLDQPQNPVLRESYLPNFLYFRYRQLSRPEVADYFHWLSDAYSGQIWETQKSQFKMLQDLCDERDIDLLVVVFPFLHNLSDYAFEDAHAALREYWGNQDVPYLDLLETMKKHDGERLVVNRYDAHPNERANAIAAEAIWEQMLKPYLANKSAD